MLGLIHAINRAPDEVFEEQISRYLDPRQLLAYLAVESFMAEHDGFTGAVGMRQAESLAPPRQRPRGATFCFAAVAGTCVLALPEVRAPVRD